MVNRKEMVWCVVTYSEGVRATLWLILIAKKTRTTNRLFENCD